MKFFLVGGAIRDKLLGIPFSERDWVVVGATPEQMFKLGYKPVGKDFPVFLHPQTKEEYALARTERKTAPGYTGFVFHTDTAVTLEEDLKRRDLTINAMAEDSDGNIIDPYGGQQDIRAGLLRHVSSAFSEDPVRLLRTARFAARYHHLNFNIAEETLQLMQIMVEAGEAKHLVAERVWQECQKAIAEKNPQIFFLSLQQSNALGDIFPELDNQQLLRDLANLQKVATKTTNPEQRFAGLCAGLSKESINTLCQRLAAPQSFCKLATLLNANKNQLLLTQRQAATEIFELFKKLDVIRNEKRFIQILETCAYLANQDERGLVSFWTKALKYFNQVDTQSLIEQGYQKAALGEAIKQSRLQQLEIFLNAYV
jgi:tRNA nucleotidyltransferase (CCA-adding enzyme)